MTVGSLLRAMVRWWYVLLAGVLATVIGGVVVLRHEGVYWSQVDVVFLAPQSARYPNKLTTSTNDLISLAGIVERIISQSEDARTASSATTLVGQGIYDGYSIRLPDSGGQWAHNFERQVLDVQVAGPSAADVRARQDEVLELIDSTLVELQDQAGVAGSNRVTAQKASEIPNIYYRPGEPRRALAMTAVLGTGVTLAIIGHLELRRRRHRSDPASPCSEAVD